MRALHAGLRGVNVFSCLISVDDIAGFNDRLRTVFLSRPNGRFRAIRAGPPRYV